MGAASNKMKAAGAWAKSQEKIKQNMTLDEVQSNIRENRQGFRGFGAFQMKKVYSSEGIYVVDVGGPPVAGR